MIDSLPYIDEIGQDYLSKASSLVEQEMRRRAPSNNYLQNLEDVEPNFDGTLFVGEEWKRVGEGKEMEKIDFFKLVKDPKETTLSQVKNCLEKAKCQLESQHIRLINLELLNSFGKASWVEWLSTLRNQKQKLAQVLKENEEKITEINRKRKAEQLKLLDSLLPLEKKFKHVCESNITVQQACQQLEHSLQEMISYANSK